MTTSPQSPWDQGHPGWAESSIPVAHGLFPLVSKPCGLLSPKSALAGAGWPPAGSWSPHLHCLNPSRKVAEVGSVLLLGEQVSHAACFL